MDGLLVPSDCCASNEAHENDHALEQMRTVLKADVMPSTELDLERLRRRVTRQVGEQHSATVAATARR
jgi:hypothetical protein